MDNLFSKQALEYHSQGRPGKLEVIPTKPYSTQKDLSLAYTPGVAKPCLEIAKTPEDVYKYTIKGNLVAVISNGTAVLGLGDIGAEAGKRWRAVGKILAGKDKTGHVPPLWDGHAAERIVQWLQEHPPKR